MSPFWLRVIALALVLTLAIVLIARKTEILRRAYWYGSFWDRIMAWRAGNKDGKDGVTADRYRGRLINQAAKLVQRVAVIGGGRDKRLVKRGRYEHAAAKAYEAKRQISDTKELISEQGLKGVHKGKNNGPYWLTMVAIGLTEFVFNAVAFVILGATMLETYIMVLGLALVLPGSAHFVGLVIKQDDQRIRNGIIGFALGVPALWCMYSINQVRAESVNLTHGAFITLSPITYYSMNLLVFVFAIALSYFHHEQHSLLSTLKNWEAKHDRSWERFARTVNARNENLGYHKAWMQTLGYSAITLCKIYERAYERAYLRATNDAHGRRPNGQNDPSRTTSGEDRIWKDLIATLLRDEDSNRRELAREKPTFEAVVKERFPSWPEHQECGKAFETAREQMKFPKLGETNDRRTSE